MFDWTTYTVKCKERWDVNCDWAVNPPEKSSSDAKANKETTRAIQKIGVPLLTLSQIVSSLSFAHSLFVITLRPINNSFILLHVSHLPSIQQFGSKTSTHGIHSTQLCRIHTGLCDANKHGQSEQKRLLNRVALKLVSNGTYFLKVLALELVA